MLNMFATHCIHHALCPLVQLCARLLPILRPSLGACAYRSKWGIKVVMSVGCGCCLVCHLLCSSACCFIVSILVWKTSCFITFHFFHHNYSFLNFKYASSSVLSRCINFSLLPLIPLVASNLYTDLLGILHLPLRQ